LQIVVPTDDRVWQGDIFEAAPASVVRDLDWVAPSTSGRELATERKRFIEVDEPKEGGKARLVTLGARAKAMLITHECVLDKGPTQHLTLARVLALASQKSTDYQDAIRDGRNREAFYLPAIADLLEESYVDLRLLTTIERVHIQTMKRVASLTEEGRLALRMRLILYWTRMRPADPSSMMVDPEEERSASEGAH
jgi:hypothetical protein